MATKRKKNTKRKVIEPMSLAEFRAKLEGIEMFNSNDWHPEKDQWDLIREMINMIVEYEEVEHNTTNSSTLPTQRTHGSSIMDTVQRPPSLPVHTPSIIESPAEFAPPGNISTIDPTTVKPSGSVPAVTPTIDTSDGQYNSAFA